MPPESQLIEVAERVARLAAEQGHDLLIIGAAALASHRYVRMTRDIDLGGNLPLPVFRDMAAHLAGDGLAVDFREPDPQDPLGGVLDLQGEFGQIQIISFADRFPAVIRDAIEADPVPLRKDSPLRVVPLPHLVALKLYAGGLKSKADVVEVLVRNPEADLQAIAMLCEHYRLDGFSEIREELERMRSGR